MKKVKQILALAGVVLLAGLYGAALILALMSSPASKGMLMAALGCTIVIPCLIYTMMLIARVLDHRTDTNDQAKDSEPSSASKKH